MGWAKVVLSKGGPTKKRGAATPKTTNKNLQLNKRLISQFFVSS
jgi:hypothetical protein